jgi:hypothetical protein
LILYFSLHLYIILRFLLAERSAVPGNVRRTLDERGESISLPGTGAPLQGTDPAGDGGQ